MPSFCWNESVTLRAIHCWPHVCPKRLLGSREHVRLGISEDWVHSRSNFKTISRQHDVTPWQWKVLCCSTTGCLPSSPPSAGYRRIRAASTDTAKNSSDG